MFFSWLPSWMRPFSNRRTRRGGRQPIKTSPTRRTLRLEELETRLVPSTTELFAGLELSAAGGFTSTQVSGGNQIAATGPVQIGLAPSSGSAFSPLLQLDGGVSYTDSDPL